MTIQSDQTVGQLAAEHPLATRVFHRHGIDFCCGGGKPLADACTARGLDAETVIAEINRELEGNDETDMRWDQAALPDLIDHILTTFHEPLREELPRLESMARKVARVHGDKMPEMLIPLRDVFLALKSELDEHMAKEEEILFPMIKQGGGTAAQGPVSCMEHEHESAGQALKRLRELTGDYEVPDGACTTWRALWHGLAALETAMHEHIHLENNILFPRALAG